MTLTEEEQIAQLSDLIYIYATPGLQKQGARLIANKLFEDGYRRQSVEMRRVHSDKGEPFNLRDCNGKELKCGDTITLDSTDIGGEIVTGEIFFNRDQCLAGLEYGLWTERGWMRTDFLGKLTFISRPVNDQSALMARG